MGTKFKNIFRDTGEPVDSREFSSYSVAVGAAKRAAVENPDREPILILDVVVDTVVRTVYAGDLDGPVFYCRKCGDEFLESELRDGVIKNGRWYSCPECETRLYKTRVPRKERYRVCHPVHVVRGVNGKIRGLRVISVPFATWKAARDAAIDLMVNGKIRPDRVLVVDEERDRTVLDLLREHYVDGPTCSRCGSDNDGGTFWADRGGYARLCDNCFALWNKGDIPDAPVETVDVPDPVKKMERRLRSGNGMPHNR